jgi:hypothetical protein
MFHIAPPLVLGVRFQLGFGQVCPIFDPWVAFPHGEESQSLTGLYAARANRG